MAAVGCRLGIRSSVLADGLDVGDGESEKRRVTPGLIYILYLEVEMLVKQNVSGPKNISI